MLIGLPGETKESHIESVKKAFDLGSYKQVISDIRTLAGSEMDEADYRVKHGIQTMFRVIPSAYGEYGKRKAVEDHVKGLRRRGRPHEVGKLLHAHRGIHDSHPARG